MEGITQTASARLAGYYRTHQICLVEDNWYAWKPAPDDDKMSGELTHGRTEDELADKLGG